MSFDKDTRNLLSKTVATCRRRLTEDVTDQLRGIFGLHPDGTVLSLDKMTHLSPDQATAAKKLRDLLDHYTASEAGEDTERRRAAYERTVLEISFTILNRLAALRMCEERALVAECVRKGTASDGFRIFEQVSGGALGARYDSYQVFLGCLFDELALDLGVLFDRLAPQSAIFPTEPCMEDVLTEMNKPQLTHLWSEDETIGWVYQYFNPPEERKAMRDASQAPRNSRELAVRNQFFTPRYVVEFLTDNTLGRIWYEMRKGDTNLKDECQYLVLRKHPIFLEQNQSEPEPYNSTNGSWGDPDLPGDVWLRPNPSVSGIIEIFQYALTAGGYDYAKTYLGVECGEMANERLDKYRETGNWEGTFEELRCCLFFEQRRYHHFGTLPEGKDLEEIMALHEAICGAWNIEVEIIPDRPKKDPRDIHILDPACGSGHFLLYAFDLLERIYEEAWVDPESIISDATGTGLRDDYKSEEDLSRAIPELILRWNLHGIDIDPRAVQIAVLALWLRAQKSWQMLSVKTSDRPQIAKSNIVTAEPMPGETDFKAEFANNLRPRVLGQLVEIIFDKMKLSGEAGSLLKIEEEIRDAVSEARKQWMEGSEPEQQLLFPDLASQEPKQQELRFDLEGINDEDFWEQAEKRIIAALYEFAEFAEEGGTIRRRLFAEDASHGFAFIDVCLKKYDIVLMNPPFGDSTVRTASYCSSHYPDAKKNMYIAFIKRAAEMSCDSGLTGCITDRTYITHTRYRDFRMQIVYGHDNQSQLRYLVDNGWGVLDSYVQTASAVFSRSLGYGEAVCVDLKNTEEPESQLSDAVTSLCEGRRLEFLYLQPLAALEKLPKGVLAFWIPTEVINAFAEWPPMDPALIEARSGMSSSDNERFYKLVWEIPRNAIGRKKRWSYLANGGDPSPFFRSQLFVIDYEKDGYAVKQFARDLYGSETRTIKNQNYYRRLGLTYGKRTENFNVQVLPSDQLFSNEGHALFSDDVDDLWFSCAYFNSTLVSYVLNSIAGLHKESGYVGSIPVLPDIDTNREELSELALSGHTVLAQVFQKVPETQFFATTIHMSPEGSESTGVNHLISPQEKLSSITSAIDQAVENMYQLSENSKRTIGHRAWELNRIVYDANSTNDALRTSMVDTMCYLVGVLFGRWDVRIALDPKLIPELPDPFDPLPVCPPGMLTGPDGLPAEPEGIASADWLRDRPDASSLLPECSDASSTIPDAEYPIRVPWDGILIHDAECNGGLIHNADIVRRVHEALDLLWLEDANDKERQACEILGVSSLQDYFGKTSGFFQDHLKRYSKGRRKAPIYWPLSTASGSYTVWLYYHRLSDQTLYTVVNKYIEPRISDVKRSLARIEEDIVSASGRESTQLRDRLNDVKVFFSELREFREELLRIAALPYKPDLNNGVIINAAPLYKLFRHRQWAKDTEECWKKLEKGNYEWTNLAYTIWPDRVREVCKTDRSIAIAHNLEGLFEVTAPIKKRQEGRVRRKKDTVK